MYIFKRWQDIYRESHCTHLWRYFRKLYKLKVYFQKKWVAGLGGKNTENEDPLPDFLKFGVEFRVSRTRMSTRVSTRTSKSWMTRSRPSEWKPVLVFFEHNEFLKSRHLNIETVTELLIGWIVNLKVFILYNEEFFWNLLKSSSSPEGLLV